MIKAWQQAYLFHIFVKLAWCARCWPQGLMGTVLSNMGSHIDLTHHELENVIIVTMGSRSL